jgi:hypothetical protein
VSRPRLLIWGLRFSQPQTASIALKRPSPGVISR